MHECVLISAELMTTEAEWHQPVMLEEVVKWLNPQPGQVMVDCTVGCGGHSLGLVPHLMPRASSAVRHVEIAPGHLIAIDRDPDALEIARRRLVEFQPHVEFLHDNFCHLPERLSMLGLSKVHGVVADLGVSSLHLERSERGFSFLRDGPLDMRMDPTQALTAAEIVAQWSEDELAMMIERYGEERWAFRIANRIVRARRQQPLRTTTQLARVVAEAVPAQRPSRRIHPATRTFQALRIVVNDELESLEQFLRILPEVLAPGGRAVLISFHSLEDRLVKYAFRQGAKAGVFQVVTKKPLRPASSEVAENPRSRSAKLRVVERAS